jgi:hypothetical protein
MCTDIYIPSEKLEIRTIGQLKARVGAENVRLTNGASEELKDATPEQMVEFLSDNTCLCSIDTDHAARSAGFYGSYWVWGTMWKRRPAGRLKKGDTP